MKDEDEEDLTTAPDTGDDDASGDEPAVAGGFGDITVDLTDANARRQLRGMYQSWYLDYASYTILDRAIPQIDDGLKPVQRRILHSMKTLDDGRYNKVANIVGNTMQYHPHGDASIYGALVSLGQKELLIDTQGNWGNVLTGASAAAGRYIEARLSPFALDVLFDDRVTQWTPTYDGRKREPVTLPAKFPLLLSQGVGGIAAGLSSLILPHNFNELIDGSIAILRGEEPVLYPDFATGGMIDVSRYNDGRRGGKVRVRARIEKPDNRTLEITEIPYGLTTGSLIESIRKAFEKGKIKIRKVDDNTAAEASIVVHLQPGTSSDKTIDALYAFTDCELSISPNCCVIRGRKPVFIGVTDVLRHSVEATRDILRRELEIDLAAVTEKLFFASLERIFIEERIYKDREYETLRDTDAIFAHVRSRLEPFIAGLPREVTDDDLKRLEEIPMKRIHRFSSDKADEFIARCKERMAELSGHLERLTEYTIDWYERLKERYGHDYPRRTEIRSFENIEATTVAEANEKLYIDREEGFIGTGLKREGAEMIGSCSSIDDIIVFYRNGKYRVTKVAEKLFVGKGVIHAAVYRRNDLRTIYNVIYRDGRHGTYYMKRFNIGGVTRDKEYDLTAGTPDSKICYFTSNPNGEAEVIRVVLKPKDRLKTLQFDVDFGQLAVKGRTARGNIVTRNEVHRFSLKERGGSTLGGRKVWFDADVLRLNYEGRGRELGEFHSDDKVLVVLESGEFYTTGFEATNHYPTGILRIERLDPNRVYTAVLYDADQRYFYLKRFRFETSVRQQRFVGDNPKSRLVALSDEAGAVFEVTFKGADAVREPLVVVAHDFVGIKSFKAKGKRLTNFGVGSVRELDPVEVPDDEILEDTAPDVETESDEVLLKEVSDEELRDEITGQERLFD